MAADQYDGENISVSFDGKRCIHARHCVLGLPGVFRANVPGPWIEPDNADVEELAALIRRCPSGALRFTRHDGGTEEQPPPKNTAKVWENGPLELRARWTLNGEAQSSPRAVLCRCGASQNKPFCDNSHRAAGFVATGEVPTAEEVATVDANGPIDVKPMKNGPNVVKGPLEILAGSGRAVQRVTKTALCRCGASQNKPYCDGSHAKIGFETE